MARSITARAWLAGAALVWACSGGGGSGPRTCTTSSECAAGQSCRDGACIAARDGAGDGAAADSGVSDSGDDGRDAAGADATFADACSGAPCGAACCDADQVCAGETCIARVACTSADECLSDGDCRDGACIPYGVPPEHVSNDACRRTVDVEALVPDVQCRWTGPPAGDGAPGHVQVMSTPVVVDFDLDDDPSTLAPSIAFASFPTAGSYSMPGVLRIIDGASCVQQFSFPAADEAVMSPASVAIGDLDADGHAEIVAAAHDGGLLAFRFDPATRLFAKWWHSGTCAADGTRVEDTTGGRDQWAGPSIHDLDDDGVPEIVYGATVFAHDGCVRSSTLGFPAYHKGIVPVVADVDEDMEMELVLGDGIYRWDAVTSELVPEPYFVHSAGTTPGQVAVGDLGDFAITTMGGGDRAEIVVVASGTVRVQNVEGTILFGPYDIPGGGTGGPPTIADFDGDGRAELATAGGNHYVVYDLDCVAGRGSGCASGRTDGVLWAQPSQDASSNVTGSSVFDFDADGHAEAVYGDECYLRIYDGASGDVLFSFARSSGTAYENPVIADVDGDLHTEIVSSVNDYAGTLDCAATDPLRPEVRFATSHGIVVLRDQLDRWAASRPVWSQHAYAVTHVGDHGEIPRSSEVAVNWRTPGLDNFRQNVQGDLAALGEPDLTSAGAPTGPLTCHGNVATLSFRVCNRGLLPVVGATDVALRQGATDGELLCEVRLDHGLAPGTCADLSCDAELPSEAIDVYIVADPEERLAECFEHNNVGVLRDVQCLIIQ